MNYTPSKLTGTSTHLQCTSIVAVTLTLESAALVISIVLAVR